VQQQKGRQPQEARVVAEQQLLQLEFDGGAATWKRFGMDCIS
jgi:hypothetical protein